MNKYVFQKTRKQINPLIFLRIFGFFLFILGLSTVIYIFSPLIIWQLTLAPAFASQEIDSPIPRRIFLTPSVMKSLVASGLQNISGADYNNVSNWFPTYSFQKNSNPQSYFLTIPTLHITNAFVSSTDMNLANHLVSLPGTSLPPDKGNAVIFGHSTLPQLFNPNDYKTIFADAYKLQIGDNMQTVVNNITYTYKIFSITVVDPEDTSVLEQQYDDSYLTVITCTPPGTVWKRLIIKARLQKLT